MIIENPEHLKNWLTNYLEPLCDADPQALAKYVMALIKKDKPEKELKSICFDQLDVFLQKETVSFVEVLFETLNNKSYLNNTPPNVATSTSPAISTSNTVSIVAPLATTTTSTTTSTTTTTQSPLPSVLTSVPPAEHNPLHDVPSSSSGVASNSQSSLQLSQPSKRSYHSRDRSKSRSRSRSRSKSRSPPSQSRHRPLRDVDMRRGFIGSYNSGSGLRNYYDDDRSRRTGRGALLPRGSSRRYIPPMPRGGGGYKRGPPNSRRSRTRSRSRSKSRSRSRSRSWSYSSQSSRSRSRSRSRNRSRTRSRSRDKEIAPNSKRNRAASKSPSPSKEKDKEKDKEGSKKRCRDYDEKGFCMRGDLCPYDHGVDPLVLDGNVLSMGLGVAANGAALLPTPAHSIAPNSYLAEPYNPEAPGIDASGNNQMRVPMTHPHPPPPGHFWGPMGPPIRGPLGPGVNHFMPQMQQGRPRELVGVPTVSDGNISNNNNNNNNTSTNNSSESTHRTVIDTRMNMISNPRRGRGGHRGGYRGGYHKRMVSSENAEKCTLEVRKIPPALNSITHLNQHFSKFGQIVNLQVSYDGDPEAALIQFASHAEALAAHRSTEAVLNNRFIKVFWHSKEPQHQPQHSTQSNQSQNLTINTDQNTNLEGKGDNNETNGSNGEKTDGQRVSAKDRLGAKMEESEKVTTAISSSGTISRTVFNPALLKKMYPSGVQAQNQPKTKLEQKKERLAKKLELQKKRQEILTLYMKEQKGLVEKLEKAKSEEEKGIVKKTLDALCAKIKVLEEELKKDAQEILSATSSKVSGSTKTKTQIEKELLDAEMDFYNKLHKGEATLELQKRLNELRLQAKAFGIADGRSAKLLKKYAAMRGGITAGRGRGGFLSARNSFENLRKVDRRTRKILIADIKQEDQIDLLSHLAQFAEVETIEHSSTGAIVTFKSRRDAEVAVSQIGTIKFKDHFTLKCAWFDETKLKVQQRKLSNAKETLEEEGSASAKEEAIDKTIEEDDLLLGVGVDDDLLEEEETDDENESRSWRR